MFLPYYATRLNAVEVNYTFRQSPTAKTLENWIKSTPDDFVFCLKAHQRITHIHRLKNAGGPVEFFLKAIDPLRATRRLGVVLFQLPPNLKCDSQLLEEFLEHLPTDIRFTFEFRNPTWFDDRIYELLRAKNCCLCQAESDKLESPPVLTADFTYYRLRKPEYSAEERAEILDQVRKEKEAGRSLYVFFKHEDTPEGALHAEELLKNLPRKP